MLLNDGWVMGFFGFLDLGLGGWDFDGFDANRWQDVEKTYARQVTLLMT